MRKILAAFAFRGNIYDLGKGEFLLGRFYFQYLETLNSMAKKRILIQTYCCLSIVSFFHV